MLKRKRGRPKGSFKVAPKFYEEGFITQGKTLKGKEPISRSPKPSSLKVKTDKVSLTAIIVSEPESRYLRALWFKSGLTAVEVFYRGLGLQRRGRIKKQTDLFEHYRRENHI